MPWMEAHPQRKEMVKRLRASVVDFEAQLRTGRATKGIKMYDCTCLD